MIFFLKGEMDKFPFFKIALNSDILQFWAFLGRFSFFFSKKWAFFGRPHLNLFLVSGDVYYCFFTGGRGAPRGPAGPSFACATTPWAHLGEVHPWGGRGRVVESTGCIFLSNVTP